MSQNRETPKWLVFCSKREGLHPVLKHRKAREIYLFDVVELKWTPVIIDELLSRICALFQESQEFDKHVFPFTGS